ncbi:MAG: hypothetical protein KAI64_04850, partial [Thermoplasmata archaeon]|nr:hypothetical protein [Thermoplasmata archaeon]
GTQTSLETGHEKLIDWDHEFVGRQVLSARKGKESAKLVGVTCSNKKAVPRRGMKIFAGGGEVGAVTSGTMSPSLRQGIALGYVTAEHCEPGTELEIQLRGRMEPAKVVKLPFL